MTLSQIEKKASALLQNHGAEVPVPVVAIAQSLGISIVTVKMPEFAGSIPSGVLNETEDGKWSILLRADDGITRQRFTIAHQIGHFLLHKNQQFIDTFPAGEVFQIKQESDEAELQANHFALCLLLPKKLVTEHWQQIRNVSVLAEFFNVSESTMQYRLFSLGIIAE